MRFRSSRKEIAQAAIEVAVFGAILLFVLSVIVRQAFNANFGQNQTLRVLRMAMTASYKTSFLGSPARNVASVIVLEDHLSPSLNKFGPEMRTPFVLSGTATHSRELFQPPTYNAVTELPRIDMFINGQHFQFTVGGYRYVSFFNPNGSPTRPAEFEPNCAYRIEYNQATLNWDTVRWVGCQKLFRVLPNYINDPAKDKFCCDDPPSCPPPCNGTRCCDPTKNLTASQRFDLDRISANNPVGLVPQSLWPDFSWQWYLVKGFSLDHSNPPPGGGVNSENIIPYEVNFGDTIVWSDAKKVNTLLDVDGDFKEETILEPNWDNTGVLLGAGIMDSQEGDLDFTRGTNATGPKPGLQDDLKMYTFIRDTTSADGGTYLLIEEGKLFEGAGDARQFVRSVQKRDKVELLERVIQLSNDTGRFCNWATSTPHPQVDAGTLLAHDNPVEACTDNCFQVTGSNRTVDKTCFVRDYNMIYVRSRLKDLGGKKWVTPVAP